MNSYNPPFSFYLQFLVRVLSIDPQFPILSIDSNRKNVHDPEYKALMDEKGIQPCDMYNFNETSFRFGVGKNQWIITRDFLGRCVLGVT